jgi:hypothetical protein
MRCERYKDKEKNSGHVAVRVSEMCRSRVWVAVLYLPSIMSVAALLPRTVDLFDQEVDPNFRLFSKESKALREDRRREERRRSSCRMMHRAGRRGGGRHCG